MLTGLGVMLPPLAVAVLFLSASDAATEWAAEGLSNGVIGYWFF
jgi:hypothetical protein